MRVMSVALYLEPSQVAPHRVDCQARLQAHPSLRVTFGFHPLQYRSIGGEPVGSPQRLAFFPDSSESCLRAARDLGRLELGEVRQDP